MIIFWEYWFEIIMICGNIIDHYATKLFSWPMRHGVLNQNVFWEKLVLMILVLVYWITMFCESYLINWGRVTHICIGKLIIIGSDKGLSPAGHQTIICTNAGISLVGLSATNVSEIVRPVTQSFGVFFDLRLNKRLSKQSGGC